MKLAELSERSGLSIPTIKYYIREKLLPAGRITARNQAVYDETHLHRLVIIRSLSEVARLSLQQTRAVLGVMDDAPDDLLAAMTAVMTALPPSIPVPRSAGGSPRTEAALARILESGTERADYHGFPQLRAALETAEAAGLPFDADSIAAMFQHIQGIAQIEISAALNAPTDQEAVATTVLGSILGEPVIAGLRRIAREEFARTRLLKS